MLWFICSNSLVGPLFIYWPIGSIEMDFVMACMMYILIFIIWSDICITIWIFTTCDQNAVFDWLYLYCRLTNCLKRIILSTCQLFAMDMESFELWQYVFCLLASYNRAHGIVGFTRRTLDGFYCSTGLYQDVGQFDQLICTCSCIISTNCDLFIYNPQNRTCLHLLGSQPCHLATPHTEFMMMRFRSSVQDQCLISSTHSDVHRIRSDTGDPRVLSRKHKDGAVCLGTSDDWANSPFYFNGPADLTVCPDAPKEIMAVHPSCTVAWVTYTTGDVLPRGAIVMGYWNGKPSYSTRHYIGNEQSFGWYVERNDEGTYHYFSPKSSSFFEILINV